jgi:hypothetical protein
MILLNADNQGIGAMKRRFCLVEGLPAALIVEKQSLRYFEYNSFAGVKLS